MAFENCSEYKLNSALRKIDNISSSRIDSLIGDINYNNWQSDTRANIVTALKEIQKEYKLIENKITKYKQVADYIDEYKSAQKKYEYYSDRSGDHQSYYNNLGDNNFLNLKDFYQDRIESYTTNANSNKQKMTQIMNKINSLMN